MPEVLHIYSPNGQQRCAGEYARVPGEAANGQPVWRQAGGDFWLYSGAKGMWIVGGADAKEKGFRCSHGNLFCRTLHTGNTPDKVSGTWSRLERDSFVDDDDISVVRGIAKPHSLRLVSPNGQHRCSGEYQLMAGDMVAGMPVWRHRSGGSWLYTGENGSWIFGGSDAKERDFRCSRGVLYSKRPHGGLMPDRLEGAWVRLAEDKFQEDPAVVVTPRPAPLYLQSPNGQQRCAGEYVPVMDKIVNGMPLWEHIGGKCWLYSGSNGMWIIGGDDAKAKNFDSTRGVIYCRKPHGGMMPDKMVGNWLRLEGDTFREDAAVFLSMKPSTLYVVTPQDHQRCAGEYKLLPGESLNGQPVWKQKKGFFRIYSSKGGMWQIAGNEAKEADFQGVESVIRCEVPHQGMMPDKVRKAWRRLDGDSFADDQSIAISTVLNKPAKLRLKSPHGQQRCAGEYVLVAGQTANGQPLWRQMGGKHWLYSGTNGMWIFGRNGAKEKNFDCSRGVIYSNSLHGGVMPDKLRSLWLRLDGEAFHEDADIKVDGDHVASRKRTAAAAGAEPAPARGGAQPAAG